MLPKQNEHGADDTNTIPRDEDADGGDDAIVLDANDDDIVAR